MNEETLIFKAYFRALLLQLKRVKEAVNNSNFQKTQKLIEELICDTQNNIED